MAENPKPEALRRNFPFIQESMATGGLSTIASHLLRLDLVTGENYRDILEPCGRGPDRQAAMLMTSVEVRIRDNPDVYFTRFVDALRQSHLGNVADRLVQALPEDQRHSTSTSPSGVTDSPSLPASVTAYPENHLLSPAMQHYVRYLKNVYKKKTTPVYDKEHTLLQVKAKSFINIALVHKDSPQYIKDSVRIEMLMDRLHGHVDVIQETKTKLFICDVCQNQKGGLSCSVLVEGAPGVGKTTFAHELCKRWAKGEILWEWAAVVLIKLRDQTTRTAQNMYDLLYHPRPEVQQAVVDELIDHDGEYILLILDGYDELTDNQKKATSVIQRVMRKELLCQSTLMVISRPLATKTLHDNFVQSIDQHIEVLGFTEKNIEEYIQSACGDKPELVEDFKSYLSCHPFSSALMFNPLQCAIVTDLYRSHWEKGVKGLAPKTLTELYTGLVHIMLVRYLTQHPAYKNEYWRIEDLSDLPKVVNQQFKAVTELAAKGIRNQQYVFDEVNTDIPLETLGLMQKEELVASGSGMSASHNFLHLTLQEYLAAVNYSQQYSSPEQLSQLLTQDDLFPLNNFLEHYGKERKPKLYSSATHWPVVLFVAGRTKLSGVPTNIFKAGLHDSYNDDDVTTVNISLLHLLYETQSPQLIQSTLVTSRKYLSVSGSSALDWFVFGYCIANSTSTWRVEKKSNDSPKHFDQLVMGLRLGPEECSRECKIGSLHISGHWTENFKILLQLQQYAKKVLTEINLVGKKQKEQSDPEKSKSKSVSEEVSACYPSLDKLTIENVKSSVSASLISFISQHSNLNILSLNQCNLSSIATNSLIHFLQSPNNRLHELTLDECAIQIPDYTNSAAISYYKLKLISPTDAGNFSLKITGSLYAINYILSQPHLFYANTLSILKGTSVSETTDSLQIDASLYPNLKKLKITHYKYTILNASVFINSQQNNLRCLLMKRCNLTCDTVRSLIHSLQSSHRGLQELVLNDCISDHTTTGSSKLKLKSLDRGNISLEFTGHCCDISHWLSLLSSYTQLTELILHLERQDITIVHTLQEIRLYHHVLHLESLKIDKRDQYSCCFYAFPLPLSVPQIIGNNLCNLSLKEYDVTRSLIFSLQSPHCRLQKLTIDNCTISTPEETQQNTISTKNNTTLHSLVTTDSLCVLNHILSNVHFAQLTELSLYITEHDSSEAAKVLTKIPVSGPVLETIKIDSIHNTLPLSIPQFIGLQQNNLHTLSLRCIFSSDVTSSLIQSLQSPHCRLHKLTIDTCKCTISTSKETQQNTIYTNLKNNTTLRSLVTTDSLCVLNHILSNVLFAQMTELSLCFTNCNSSKAAEVLTKIPLSCPVLETVIIIKFNDFSRLPIIPQFIGLQQSNPHTLSLSGCNLESDFTKSLIHSMQSPHSKLHKLAIKECTISLPEDTQQARILMKTNVALHSLCISWSVLDQMMSCINPFTQSLTELILHVDCNTHAYTSGVEAILQEIPSNCPLLETLNIIDSESLPLSIPQFIGSQQNNLHTLSLKKCELSSDVTRSLIHSLQSPYCKLYKLVLYFCTIHPSDYIQLTTAIVSSTTITHLFFIFNDFYDEDIDTPSSLTALASGLKHNSKIEQLAFDTILSSFTKDQFQVLIDAVDSSAVKKLWLHYSDSKLWFDDVTLSSRKNVKIEWCYDLYNDLYNKWSSNTFYSTIGCYEVMHFNKEFDMTSSLHQ